ncbi:MAG: DinB family protein [Anaerolineales bacterium]
MNTQDIQLLFDYNYWANRQILKAAAQTTPEQFVAPVPNTYGSLRAILVHTGEAEHFWRNLCQHGTFTEDWTEAEFPALADLATRWREVEHAMRAYVAGLSDEALLGWVRYTTPSGVKRERVLWHCLLHVVNHGTQHRSEAAMILTNYGQSPGDLDFTIFLNSRA